MALSTPSDPPLSAPTRRRALDNPRVLVALVLVLLGVLIALVWLPRQLEAFDQALVSEVVLYALSAVDLAMLAALLFVLARNILKLWVERRRGAPFARFRAKLVAALLMLTILPASLVLVIGSSFIRSSIDRWFSAPVDEVLDAARLVAAQYYAERQDTVITRSERLARILPVDRLTDGDVEVLRATLAAELSTLRDGLIELYRTVPQESGARTAALIVAVEATTLPRDLVRASADRLAERVAASGRSEPASDSLESGGVLVRAAAPIGPPGAPAGVVVVSQHMSADVTTQSRRATAAYERYGQLKVLKGPLQGVYLMVFLMITLLILVSATWLGLYVAKRITRPVQMLAEGARAIGAGQLDLRLEPETADELGSLVESFNMMAADLRSSQERLELSRVDLERTNIEVEARRRYIETILERVATGVISLDAAGRISTINGAASRLLGLDHPVVGQDAATVFAREDLRALAPLVQAAARREPGVLDLITLARPDQEVHLAGAVTVLTRDDGRPEGAVVVLDDVTLVIRTQKVAAWSDVARRLAHEIKNPLTPIQLSAERLRRNFANAPPNARALVDECTSAIITEVEALKGLVDEFAQFARLRGPRATLVNINQVVEDTLRLYGGVLEQGALRLESDPGAGLPEVRLDVEQMRQVLLNLVDNAVEALGGPGAEARPDGQPPTVIVATRHDAAREKLRITVTDNGPGVPPADRDKLFMPYYSTKGRGSGLGLSIVKRMVAQHGGSIEVGDASPAGTVFTIELPVG